MKDTPISRRDFLKNMGNSRGWSISCSESLAFCIFGGDEHV